MRNGLAFFKRTSAPRSWNIASYHDPRSLTWSWVLSFSLFRGDERRVFPLWGGYRDNHATGYWFLRLPFVGIFGWHRQEKMMGSYKAEAQ